MNIILANCLTLIVEFNKNMLAKSNQHLFQVFRPPLYYPTQNVQKYLIFNFIINFIQ